MDFKETIKDLSERIIAYKDLLHNEEQTKDALIKPFVRFLMGYDCSNPLEVKAEMHCDVGIKKGEKVDYCILNNGEPIILIECKRYGENLSTHYNQLFRYFSVSEAKFAILTNGITYQFFTDLVKPNIMDEKPFIEIDLTNIEDWQIDEIQKFHKSVFDAERIRNAARKRKDTEDLATRLKNTIKSELHSPSEDLVNFFIEKVCGKELSQELFVYFSEVVKRHFVDLIADKSNVATTHPQHDIGTNRHRITTSSGKDKSQYAINGKGKYSKRRMVEAVINLYVKQHPNITVKELKSLFDFNKNSRLKVIKYREEVGDLSRVFESRLPTNEVFYIDNQWGNSIQGGRFESFISHVNTNIEGITITKIE